MRVGGLLPREPRGAPRADELRMLLHAGIVSELADRCCNGGHVERIEKVYVVAKQLGQGPAACRGNRAAAGERIEWRMPEAFR